MNQDSKTYFGYTQVSPAEKTRRVRQVFESVSKNYDVMNDLMSFGLHRLWKKFALQIAAVRPRQTVLDLAAGTGDLAAALHQHAAPCGRVVLCDINASMLAKGRQRMLDRGVIAQLDYVQADAEVLPFKDNSFDCITMAFGLRNVTHQEKCLASVYAKLKPAGRFIVLEFSRPHACLRWLYDRYSFSVLPRLGDWVANDAGSYRYLAESIRMHPDQETLRAMFKAAGFDRCRCLNMSGGIVAVHIGYKY